MKSGPVAWPKPASGWRGTALVLLVFASMWPGPALNAAGRTPTPMPPPELATHLASIIALAVSSPTVLIPEGTFLLGSVRVDDDPYGKETQFDDTELPQLRVAVLSIIRLLFHDPPLRLLYRPLLGPGGLRSGM